MVRDLKEQDKDAYEKLKKTGGKTGVITSVVSVSDDGTESVVAHDVGSGKSKTNANLKHAEGTATNGKDLTLNKKKGDENLKIVASDSPEILDAMDAQANRKQQPVIPEVKKVEVKKAIVKAVKPASLDREIPESGVRVVEKTK